MDAGLIDLASQVTVAQTGENGLLCGIDDYDAVGSLGTTALGILLALGDVGIAQTVELLLAVDPYHSVVGRLGQEVAPLLLEVGDTRVNLLHALHLVGREHGARTHKAFIYHLGESLVFAGKALVLVVVYILDALEELLVERYLVVQVGEQGSHLLLGVGDDGRLVGTAESEEHIADILEQHTAVLVGEDGVGEGRFGLVVHYLLDVLTLLLDRRLDGRQVVGLLDACEVGRSKGQSALLEQRVLSTGLVAVVTACTTGVLGICGDRHLQQSCCQSDGNKSLVDFHIDDCLSLVPTNLLNTIGIKDKNH